MGSGTGLETCDEFFEEMAGWQDTDTNYLQNSGTESSGFSLSGGQGMRKNKERLFLHLPPLPRNSTRYLALS